MYTCTYCKNEAVGYRKTNFGCEYVCARCGHERTRDHGWSYLPLK
jgi:hypothetical protein